jgi:hypothetical protein
LRNSKGLSLHKDPDLVSKSGSRSKGYTTGVDAGSSATSSRVVTAVIVPMDDSTKDNTLRHQKGHRNLRGNASPQSRQVRMPVSQQATNPGLAAPLSSEQNSIDSARVEQTPHTGNFSDISSDTRHVGCLDLANNINTRINLLSELKGKVKGVYYDTKTKLIVFNKTFMWFVDPSPRSSNRRRRS